MSKKANQKPFYTSIWFMVLAVIVVIGVFASMGGSDESKETSTSSSETSTSIASPSRSESSTSTTSTTEAAASSSSSVSREFKNALSSAKNDLSYSAFSEKGLYDQLTSEYGEQFPADAAQYAIEHCGADWNAEALESAESYLEMSPMSDAQLYDQLTSEYGEQFTPEQAQYVINHLAS